jgi:hypothetical protein
MLSSASNALAGLAFDSKGTRFPAVVRVRESDNLKSMVTCCLPSLTALKVEGQPQVAVTCDPLALLDFLKKGFMAMNRVCERAEMFEDRIGQRTRVVFEYFGLPYAGTLLA